MPLVMKRPVYLWSKNDEIFLVESIDLETGVGDAAGTVAFHAVKLEDKQRSRIAAEVDSNLLDKLVEFSSLQTDDIFLVKQTDPGQFVYGIYPSEEWKARLEKLRTHS